MRYLFPHKGTTPLINSFKKKGIENPQTVGGKILSQRLKLGLLQTDVARIIGVSTDTITNWENGRGGPQFRSYPKVIEFLGYFPLEIDTTTLGGRIKECRYL